MTTRRLACLACALTCLLTAAEASAQVAPRMMIAFDTSGSMAVSLDGVPTYGDGVTTGCSASAEGYLCGSNCTAGLDTDCDGEPDDSRMFVAKEAVRQMVLSYGDVDWALSRFPMLSGVNLVCDTINDLECDGFLTSYGNPQCNTGREVTHPAANCPYDLTSPIPDACEPGQGSNSQLRIWDGGSPSVCINYAGQCQIGNGANARGGDILVGFPDTGAFVGMSNQYSIVSWVDGQETNFNSDTTEGNYCDAAGSGDCELRPTGSTPLAGLIETSGEYMLDVRSGDGQSACRPYYVVLITDGVEQCQCSAIDPANCQPPLDAAAALLDQGIRTYVVGLSVFGDGRTQLNNIATAGGTDAGDPGGDTAFFADDPVSLSAGLSSIVADSLLLEICNGEDDDCDGLIDEGVANACGGCGPAPTESCNGDDDDCDGTVDEGVSNACGSCGPVPSEECNRVDDDCDGIIDEDGAGGSVCPGGCSPTDERCDNIDNDCDGSIDEALTRDCGSDIGECSPGTQTCSAGGWGTCTGGVGPAPEECDTLDNDCDGQIDGFSQPCGESTGQCVPGNEVCTDGAFGECIGAIGPSGEVCDGEDDDCDGQIDEGDPGGGGECGTGLGICSPGTLECMGGGLTCVGGSGPDPSETCNGLDDDCDGRVDEEIPPRGTCGDDTGECRQGVESCVSGDFQCVGARGPSEEVCDGLDNDCDGTADQDNPGGGAVCGTDTGECTAGTTTCTDGAIICVGSTPPGTEACNTLDDDCDGLIDEGNPDGGTACGDSDVGLCEFGAEACEDGSLVCVGATGPTGELCNGADDDCDGMVDEDDPEGGAACGDDTGACMAGVFRCIDGALECEGSVGPTDETCNGVDDDCDGVVDDGIAVGAACGTDVGECVPGVNICREGGLECEGSIGPEAESCDNLDNDCDGEVDEGLGVGDACGSEQGLCMPGALRCISGRMVCEGEVGPTRDSCDCEDNDCDGTVDEAPETGSLCPAGSTCTECQCALPCLESEFGFSCPTGKAASVNGAGDCFCVAELCDPEACGAETVERDGETLCAPDSDGVSSCVCKNNECTFPCDGVTCADGTVCDPRDPNGRCVEDSCRGLGCPAGEVCDTDSGECAADACAAVTCEPDQACREGSCEATCASVECGDEQRCHAGACMDDPCAGVSCETRQVCDPSLGECIEDLCVDTRCPRGEVCDLASGDCVADPCNTLRCPSGTLCEQGECVAEMVSTPDAGVDAGAAMRDAGPPDERDRVLAAGGCMCRVGATPVEAGSTGTAGWLLALGLLGLVLLRRRRRRASVGSTGAAPALTVVTVGAVALLASGCEVDPFCLDCGEELLEDAGADGGPADAGRRDAGGRPDAGVDAGQDAGPDACLEEELCNELDDDCDGEVDEGIDLAADVDNCGSCGTVCNPIGAFPACTDGECGIASCDVGRLDLDGDPDNGCEYRCLVEADDDAICDRRDNDCDGTVDEDVDLNTDVNNCGACGRDCRFAHASSDCVDGGCQLGDCDEFFYDADEVPDNGCEYACVPADPAVEECNGRDDDCDSEVDEGDPGGGGACGSSTGACTMGVEECRGGTLVCAGSVGPSTETCDGVDEDCDGEVDEGNPGGGRVCGTSTGTCEAGRMTCMDGSLQCVGEVDADPAESCDGLDNDCDGSVDEGNPEGGSNCGVSTGECAFGTLTCVGGSLSCQDAVRSTDELCDGLDNDCDGTIDENNPEGGASCGTDQGICAPGVTTCSGGTLSCEGEVGPRAGGELCNALDDDCDGDIDEGDPEGGASCGTGTGECRAGTVHCAGGTLQCQGSLGPSLEECNSLDDDCDGDVDEDFDLQNSVSNCGTCGNICSYDHAYPTCNAGTCELAACETGWVDENGDPSDGCEYACDFAGDEICNGVDDDCDRATDEELAPPATFCNPNGVCAGATLACNGSAGWECTYPATYEEVEETCDGLDNDCDGGVDEPFPSVGTSCGGGVGACRSVGTFECSDDGSGTQCTAPPQGAPADFESCNDVDDDCDGAVDEDIPVDAIPTVTMPSPGGGTFRMMVYEASRPDAESDDAGNVQTHACSNPSVLPWTNVTWGEARAACCALNASGGCAGDGAGWRLCDAPDWEAACTGPTMSCDWSYGTGCATSAPLTCNGQEYDSDPSTSGDQDALMPTGSTEFGMCFTDWDGAGVVYDLSGNVKEWTNTTSGEDVYEIRGGSYNNIEEGRTCHFDFTVGDTSFAFPNTGFRCCYYE